MLSIIINSNRPAQFTAVTEMYHRVLANHPHEIIGIHDSKSAAEGLMRGYASARGDTLIFSHDDIEFLRPDLAQKLQSHLARFDIVGIAGTTRLSHPLWSGSGPPHLFGQIAYPDPNPDPNQKFTVEIFGLPTPAVPKIQSLDGVFIAATRKAIEQNPFDPVNYTGRHLYDADFCLRAHRQGLKLAVACDLPMIHLSHGSLDQAWETEAAKFLTQHGPTLPPCPKRRFIVCTIPAVPRENLLEVMTPPNW
jgi:Glycosyltransferase like family